MSMCYSSNINIKLTASVARRSDCDFSFPTKGACKQSTDGEILVKPQEKVIAFFFLQKETVFLENTNVDWI